MSRWAHGRPAVNSRRNAAAYSPPPQRTQSCWARSAILLLWIRSSIDSGIGIGHCDSPASTPAATIASTTSWVPSTPPIRSPRASTMWPVSVATSRITSGFCSVARTSASARTSRPSASVLSTSTVLPPYIVRTSPGRVAEPETMFSAMGTNVDTFTGSLSAAIARVAWTTAAAPAMSHFMVFMPWAGLIDRPPESNVIPLPTRARWVVAPLGA